MLAGHIACVEVPHSSAPRRTPPAFAEYPAASEAADRPLEDAVEGVVPSGRPTTSRTDAVDELVALACKGGLREVYRHAERCFDSGDETVSSLCETLIEPARRHLARAWQRDALRGAEVSLAMGALLSLVRRLLAREHCFGTELPSRPVLIVNEPGQPHPIAATILAHVFECGGWDATVVSPGSAQELRATVAERCDDVVLLCGDALGRAERAELQRRIDVVRDAASASDPAVLVYDVASEAARDADAAVSRVGAAVGVAEACSAAKDRAADSERTMPAPNTGALIQGLAQGVLGMLAQRTAQGSGPTISR